MATQDISQLVVEVQSKGIQTATNQLDKLAVASDKAEVAVKKLGTSVIGVNGTLSGGVANAAALVGAMTTLTAVLNRMSQSTTTARTATRAHNEAMAEAHALARGLSGSLGALWVTYGNLAGMGVGIALGASLKGVVSVGKDVEHTLEQIRVLGGASTKEMEAMGQAVTDLGKGAQGPRDVAEALSVLTLAGLNATQAMQGVGASLNLAVAGGVSVEKAAETLVQVSSSLGYTADGFDHVADVITKAASASMSSVESISGAFKSAAAVGAVYGASLQDIAIGLAAVANLGIQGTAAGTALKNFYKDLSASTAKVTNTLKSMKMSISDFRDSEGFMLPLVTIVKKLNDGLGTLDGNARSLAQVKLFSQQGVREWGALSNMINTAANDTKNYANRLEELQDEIKKAAAFSTTAAIAMGQTTNNQMKSVANTLQSVFVDAFKEVAPQIGEVSRALKAAFNSPEFKEGLKFIITGVADLTKLLVENAKAIGLVVAAWGTFKAVQAATALVAVAQGFTVAAGAAAGFVVALGPIAVAIAAMSAAWLVYKANQDTALNNKAAQANIVEYTDALIKAAEKEEMVKEMRLKNMSDVDMARALQIKEDKDASDAAVKNAEKGLAAMKKAVEDMRKKHVGAVAMGDVLLAQGKNESSYGGKVDEYVKAVRATEIAERQLAMSRKVLVGWTEKLTSLRAENGAAADAKARANLENRPTGEEQLLGKEDLEGQNAAYAAAMAVQVNIVKNALREIKNFRDQETEAFKAGKIGQLQLSEAIANKELETHGKIAAAKQKMIDRADSTKGKGADAERIRGELEAENDRIEQSEAMRIARRETMHRNAEESIVRLRVKALEDQGQFEEAARLKWSTDGQKALEQATADLMQYGEKFPWLQQLVEEFAQRRDAAIASGSLKDSMNQFEVSALRVANTLKGFKASTAGTSLGEMMKSATEASKRYNTELTVANAKYAKLKEAAKGGSEEAVKNAEEAQNKLLGLSEKHRQMWTGVGETIGSALETAFGRGGKALGDMYKAKIAMDQNDNKSTEAKLQGYGAMAQAASGFFDKQSKGYKALNGISQAFHVASMARTLAQTAASVVAGAAQFFAQSGWGGFAGVAAMGAVLAGLGYAVAGGSSGSGGKSAEEVQKTQGTGGVFGDAQAKSESISKSIEALEQHSSLMLPLTQGMLSALRNIEASMTGLTNLVVRAGGVSDGSNLGIATGKMSQGMGGLGGSMLEASSKLPSFFGAVAAISNKLWGKTTQTIIDAGLSFSGKVSDLQDGKGFNQYASVDTTKSSFFGLKKTTTNSVQTQGLNQELSSQFALIFTSLEDTLKLAATSLGSSSEAVGKVINDLVIETSTVSLKGLTGQDLQDALNGVISKTMDTIAEAAFPAMGAFRQVGEGYAQTVIRVASGIEQAGVALKEFGISAIDYTAVLQKTGDVSAQIVRQSIVLAEGVSGVGDMMKAITGTASEMTDIYRELVKVRKTMSDVNLGTGLSIATVEAAGGLDKLAASVETYYDKYFSATERAAIETRNLTDKFSAIGYALPDSREQLRKWIEVAATAGDQAKVGGLLSLAGALDKLFASTGGDAKADALANALSALDDAFERLTLSVTQEKKSLEKAYKLETEAAKAAHDKTMERLQARAKADAEMVEKRSAEINESISGIERILNALESAIEATTPFLTQAQAYAKAMGVAKGAVGSVRAGVDIGTIEGLENAIKELSKPSDGMYSTMLDFQIGQVEANNVLKSLKQAGGTQLTDAQATLKVLEAINERNELAIEREQIRFDKQMESLELKHTQHMERLDATLEAAREQLDTLKGIDVTLMTVANALRNFNGAAASAATIKATAAQGGDTSQAGTMKAIDSLYKNLLGRGTDAGGASYWADAIKNGASLSTVAKQIMESAEYESRYPSFDVGTNFVTNDTLANVHKGERIMPAADNAELMRRLKSGEESSGKSNDAGLEAVIKELIEVIKIGDTANVQKLNDLLRIIRNWDNDGTPPERPETE